MGVGGIIEVVPALEEHVAGQEVDEQVAWLWVGYLRLVPGLECGARVGDARNSLKY